MSATMSFPATTRTILCGAVIAAILIPGASTALGMGGSGDDDLDRYQRLLIRGSADGQAMAIATLAGEGFASTTMAHFEGLGTSYHKFTSPVDAAGASQIEAIITALIASGQIEAADFDHPCRLDVGEGQTGSVWVSSLGIGSFTNQYGSAATHAPSTSAWSPGYRVRVAVIDTGLVPQAPEAGTRSTVAGYTVSGGTPSSTGGAPLDTPNGIDDDGDTLVDEGVGHGSFVAGLISMVAPQSRQLHIKVLDSDGRCNLGDVEAALNLCATAEHPHVINMSLIPLAPSGVSLGSLVTLNAAITNARMDGSIVIGCAGNQMSPTNPYNTVGSPDMVIVGAVDSSRQRWSQSNHGSWVDIYAPGVTDYDASGLPIAGQSLVGPIGFVPGTLGQPGWACGGGCGGFTTASGTSFSAALVSGAAVAFRAQHATWPDSSMPASGIHAAFEAALAASADPPSGANGEPTLHGLSLMQLAGSASFSPRWGLDLAPTVALDPVSGTYGATYSVDGLDFTALVAAWGLVADPRAILYQDVTVDGSIDGTDLTPMIAGWGGTAPPPLPPF